VYVDGLYNYCCVNVRNQIDIRKIDYKYAVLELSSVYFLSQNAACKNISSYHKTEALNTKVKSHDVTVTV